MLLCLYFFLNFIFLLIDFFFYNLIYRRIQKFNLKNAYVTDKNIYVCVRSLMALAFLPYKKIEKTFIELSSTIPKSLVRLFNWFHDNYIDPSRCLFTPKQWSCHQMNKKRLPRSTNAVESFHRNVNDNLIKRPTILRLIRYFQEDSRSNRQLMAEVDAGHQWPVRTKRVEQLREERLQRVLNNFNEETDNLNFLKNVSANLKK